MPPAHTAASNSRSSLAIVLIVVALVIVLGIVTCGGLAWWLALTVKSTGVELASSALKEAIGKSELSGEDKRAVNVQIDRVGEAFKAGDLSLEQLGGLIEELGESPLLVVAMFQQIGTVYLESSELSSVEKSDARLTLQRVARGVAEEVLDQQQLLQAVSELMETGPDGTQKLKNPREVPPEQLRLAIDNCRRMADDAGISMETYEVNIGAEFKRIVDEALAK